MRHVISQYPDGGYKKVSFCVYCGCEDTVKLLDGECPGFHPNGMKAEKQSKNAENWQKEIDKLNQKA